MWSVARYTEPHSPVEIYLDPRQQVQYPQVAIHANGKSGFDWGSDEHRERMQGVRPKRIPVLSITHGTSQAISQEKTQMLQIMVRTAGRYQ